MRVDSRNVDELVRIQDAETSVVEFNDAILAQISEHSIDVDAAEAGRVSNVLLGKRKVHYFAAMARPLHGSPMVWQW